MTEYLGSTLEAHARAFDRMVEQTDLALSHPKVVEDLGELAIQLRQENTELILPNIIHGKLVVPISKRESNGALFLPFLRGDKEALKRIGYGRSVLVPTPQRVDWLRQQISTHDPAADPDELINSLHARYVKGFKKYSLSKTPLKNGLGATRSISVSMNSNFPSVYLSRSLIVTNSKIANGDIAYVGHVLAHEKAHAREHELEEKEKSNSDLASLELLPYHVGYTIYKAHHPDPDPEIDKLFKRTIEVENLRLSHTTPDEPFAASAELSEILSEIGVLR